MASTGPILLVDDDETYRALLRLHLEARGYSTLEAEDGLKAQHVLSEIQIPLVILDIVMPDHEGLETLCRLRRDGYGAKVIMASGVSRASQYLELAYQLGADACFLKARPVPEIVDMVEKLLDDNAPAPARGWNRQPAVFSLAPESATKGPDVPMSA